MDSTADRSSIQPPLRERLGLRKTSGDGLALPATRSAAVRTGAQFAFAAGLLGFLSLIVPDAPIRDETLLAIAAWAAVVLGLLLLAGFERIPGWGLQIAAASGTVVATTAVYAWGTESAYTPLPYLWVALFVFLYFSTRAALVHMALIAGGYALALALQSPPGTPVDGWIATSGTLLVTGLLVASVRDRLVSLISGLTDAARRDPLTELLNRRGFEEVFDLELERTRRTGAPLSVVIGDLDRFKRINDELGHAAGDEALRRIGGAISLAKRSFDAGARVGGEEFALLAPDCDEHGAYILAERIRREVARSFNGALTASFGIASFPLHGQSAEGLLRAADQALYAAKRLGRNRSVISSAEVPGILARAPRAHEDGHVELSSLLNLAEALDVRDWGNSAHCHRVGRFAELTARELGLAPDSVEHVRLAGILHDVGRVGMPDALLSKPGPLTEEEWAWVRSHPEVGARMVETTDFDDIRSWILAHHERPDGRGYPIGLEGEQLPFEARILAVADAYEAMTSDRSYRSALGPAEAATELRRGAGRQFDEQVVEALLRVV